MSDRHGPFDVLLLDPPWNERGGGKIKRGADRHYVLETVDQILHTIVRSPAWSPASDALVWCWATDTFREACVDMMRALGLKKSSAWVWVKTKPVFICPACTRIAKLTPMDPDIDVPRVLYCDCGWDETSGQAPIVLYKPEAPGTGQWSRCSHEHLILFKRGSPKVPPPKCRPNSVIYAPRPGEHSEKPGAAFEVIESVSLGSFRGNGASVFSGENGGLISDIGAGDCETFTVGDLAAVEMFARVRSHGWAAWGRLDGEDQPVAFEDKEGRRL